MITFILISFAMIAITCESGAKVTYVNGTSERVFVEVNNIREKVVEPRAKSTFGVIGRDQDPYVVTVTDAQGNVLYHEETTFGEIKKRNQPIVIEEPTPHPISN
jgi:hypothetical protein